MIENGKHVAIEYSVFSDDNTQIDTNIGKDPLVFLFGSHQILPALEEGKIVLCDRFNDSTLAYQGAARSLNVDLLRGLCLAATDGLIPNLTLYLDLDPKVGLSRAKQKNTYDRLEEENISFHTKVREAFLSLATDEPDRFHVIDASKDVDSVYIAAMREINDLVCLK